MVQTVKLYLWFPLWVGTLALERISDTFSAHIFKLVYLKQTFAAPLIETSQHYSMRALRWSSCCLQALVGCSGVCASPSYSLSAKKGRNKSTGKLIRKREDLLSAL